MPWRLGAGLGAGLVALTSFVVVALATAGPTAAVRPPAEHGNAHAQNGRTLAGPVPTAGNSGTPPPSQGSSGTSGSSGSSSSSSSLPAATLAEIQANADWILKSQLPDGAIAWYTDQKRIAPYEASYAALGLVRATRVTGNADYLAAAWRWLSWYQAHEDANGYVTDYNVAGGLETSTGDMDSTDAYAGMFLAATEAAWNESHDRAQLTGLASGIAGALNAIESTQQSDGLTWAKPSWQVKYAMDQAETYAGLRAAAQLEQALHNASLARRAANDADRLQQGFAQLWDAPTGAYDWAVHADGARATTNWSNLYPDAAEQVWPVAFGLVSGTKAQQIVQHFTSAHPEWDSQYWPVAGWALQAVGSDSAAQTAATSIEAVAQKANHAWPFTTAVAGELIVLESGGFAA